MNSAGVPKRRSARLSAESAEENEPPTKKTKVNGTETTTVTTKEQDGESAAAAPKRRRKEGEIFSNSAQKFHENRSVPVSSDNYALNLACEGCWNACLLNR